MTLPTRRLVNHYGLIAIEDLTINGMVHNRCLAKSIHDAAWSQFRQCLSYKAEEASRMLVAVNPAYTSQDCSQCGHRQRKSLSQSDTYAQDSTSTETKTRSQHFEIGVASGAPQAVCFKEQSHS